VEVISLEWHYCMIRMGKYIVKKYLTVGLNSISKKSYKIVRPINDTNKEYLNYLLENQTWENICKQTSVNAAYSEFVDIFNYCYETAMPKLLVRFLQHGHGSQQA